MDVHASFDLSLQLRFTSYIDPLKMLAKSWSKRNFTELFVIVHPRKTTSLTRLALSSFFTEFLAHVEIILVITLSYLRVHKAVVCQAEWVIQSFRVNRLRILPPFFVGLSKIDNLRPFWNRGPLLRFWSWWFRHEAVLESVFTKICAIDIINRGILQIVPCLIIPCLLGPFLICIYLLLNEWIWVPLLVL